MTLNVSEFDPDNRIFHGWKQSLGPGCDDLGFCSLEGLEEVRIDAGPVLERDFWWTSVPRSRVRSEEAP